MTNIHGFKDHPNADELTEYKAKAPDAPWKGKLDHLAWGKSSNLFCYFTDLASGDKRRLSVFKDKFYMPLKAGPTFTDAALGALHQINTRKSKTSDFPIFEAARVIED